MTRRVLAIVAIAVLAVIAVGLALRAQDHNTLQHIPSPASVVATSADVVQEEHPAALAAPYSLTVIPRSGEGIASLVARNCAAADWRSVAAANGITAPRYVLRLGQRVRIDCPGPVDSVAGAVPTPAPSSADPSPAAPAPAWTHPTDPGDCYVPNGSREYGTSRPGHRHGGVDLGPVSGVYRSDAVHAVHAGVAHHGYQAGGAGTYVWVDHGDGSASFYFHLGSRAVGDGARVTAGQTIGYVGSSGNATGPHLHLEVKVNGSRVDPALFLADRGVRIRCA